MELLGIYKDMRNEIAQMEANHCPISELQFKNYSFKVVDPQIEDEIFRAEMWQGNNLIRIYIISHEHDRTNQLTPDTFHNYIEYWENGILKNSYTYMYCDDIG